MSSVCAPGWDDQQAFLAVMEEGSLSAAARRLAISQPTARVRIAALEAALETALFTRGPNGMVPTRQAYDLLPHVRTMQRSSDALVRAAAGEPGTISGSVRLGVSEFVGIEVLPAMLSSLRRDHPGLRLEIDLSNLTANLLDQEVDIAIRMTDPKQQALVARKVGSIPLGFFAHPDYLAALGTPAVIGDLRNHDIIGPDRSPADLQLLGRHLPDLPLDRLTIRTDSHPAQLAAARAGLGIAVVQVPTAEASGLVRVLQDNPIGTLGVWLVTHEDLRHVPRIRAVMDHLAAGFGADGGER